MNVYLRTPDQLYHLNIKNVFNLAVDIDPKEMYCEIFKKAVYFIIILHLLTFQLKNVRHPQG